jgi:integrase
VKLSAAIDVYIADASSSGRINSPSSERSYRSVLARHAEDVGNRDPHTIGREDVKRTLRRWPNPNTQRVGRSILISFYDYCIEEGWIKYNPARQTRRPKKQPTSVYRLTKAECAAMLDAVETERERWIIYLGLCAGLRNAELRGLQGKHFRRDGFIWVSADIAKGRRERWLPVLDDLVPIVEEIKAARRPEEFVLCAQRWRDTPRNTVRMDLKLRPSSSQALRNTVMRVAKRAGIDAHIHPHLLRHAFCDHISRFAGERVAQKLMGHTDIKTTQIYMGDLTPDELMTAIRRIENLTFRLPPDESPAIALEATTGIEPVGTALSGLEPSLVNWLRSQEPKVELYAEHFRGEA